jgi:hypothetical protein
MLRLFLLPALVAAFATTASAQTIVVRPNDRSMMPPAAEQIRVSVGVNMFVPAPSDNSEQSLKAQEDARRMVYNLAAHECTILRDILASECRLDTININVQRVPANQNFGQAKSEGFNITGNIGFRIVPK